MWRRRGEDCKAVLYYYRSDIGDDDSGWGFYNNKIAPFPSLSLSLPRSCGLDKEWLKLCRYIRIKCVPGAINLSLELLLNHSSSSSSSGSEREGEYSALMIK